MIKVGKTYGNLMVDVQIGSEKLKDRARRIVVLVTGIDYETGRCPAKRAKWNVKGGDHHAAREPDASARPFDD
jgi:N-acetylmuramic acid 6-phosphate etherase